MTTLPAKTLTLAAPDSAKQDSSITVSVSGLAAGEKFTITIAGAVLFSGAANKSGSAKASVPIGKTAMGSQTLVATGSAADRTGSRPIIITDSGTVTTRTKQI
jgi:hypothetical protein